MLAQQDIDLAQLLLGRGILTLPALLQIIATSSSAEQFETQLLGSSNITAQTLNDLRRTLASADATTRETLVEQGQTIVLQHSHQRPKQDKAHTLHPPHLRYELEHLLGKGGMGQVWLAQDDVIHRQVAMKFLHTQHVDDPINQAQLRIEAQVTGKLEHPGIVPVYDLGDTDEHGPYYTMRVVNDPSLKHLLREIKEGTRPNHHTKLISILRRTLLALQYAHDHGVVHRDIKPSNILVGSYGEVFIIDWGVAKIDNSRLKLPNIPLDTHFVQEGTLIGTPRYMSPEQARGVTTQLDARSDVYAVGVILFELLTQTHFFEAKGTIPALYMAGHGLTETPSQRRPDLNIPRHLEEICLRALAKKPEDRFQSALEMASELELYLEGIKQREQALSMCAQALKEAHLARDAHQQAKAQLRTAEVQRDHLRTTVPTYAPVEDKHRLWTLEQSCVSLLQHTTKTFHDAVRHYQRALTHDPENATARRALSDLFFNRLIEFEVFNDFIEASNAEAYLRQYDDGHYAMALEGLATVTIPATEVPVSITLSKYDHTHLLYTLEEQCVFGDLPRTIQLPHGSYRLTLNADGYKTIHYPIALKRLSQKLCALDLIPEHTLPKDLVVVPEGEFISGNAQHLGDDTHQRLPTFAIMRYPVTCQDYLEFLNDRQWHDFQTALSLAPRLKVEQNTKVYFDHDGHLFSIPTEDAEGDAWHPLWPICLVNHDDAEHYARWRSARDGRHYTLPTKTQWEKAARGVDGRTYPWGSLFDAALCNIRDSHNGRAFPSQVGTYPYDCSPYGAMDMSGNIAEWTSSNVNGEDDIWIIKGASFAFSHLATRLANELASPGHFTHSTYGFRLCTML